MLFGTNMLNVDPQYNDIVGQKKNNDIEFYEISIYLHRIVGYIGYT